MYSGNIIICAVSILVLSFNIGRSRLLVGWGLVHFSSVVDWGSVVSFSSVVDWGGMISWRSLVNWSRGGISLIRYIGNVPSVVISSILYILTSTVRKQDRVMSINVTTIGVFSSFEIGSSIIIAYTISIMIRSWFVFWFMV